MRYGRIFAAGVAFLAVAAVGCTKPPSPAPTTPGAIVGVGTYSWEIFDAGQPLSGSTDDASFALDGPAPTYTGSVLRSDPANPENYAEMTTSGNEITSVYLRDESNPAGVGYEFFSSTVATSTVTDPACTGNALEVLIDGYYTSDGVSTPYTSEVTWVICDQQAAAHYG